MLRQGGFLSAAALRQRTTCAVPLKVRLVVDYGVGDNWLEAH